MNTTKSRTILHSDTVPRVELDFMNNTHFEEIEMVRKLGELITHYQESDSPTQTDADTISQALQEWVEHTKAHFSRENELMQETAFPAYPIHSGEHGIALDQMQEMAQTWESGKNIELVADYVFSQWPSWFNGHVSSMDMMTAQFAVMNGYDEN